MQSTKKPRNLKSMTSYLEIAIQYNLWNDGYPPEAFTLNCKDGEGSKPLYSVTGLKEIYKVMGYFAKTNIEVIVLTPPDLPSHRRADILHKLRPGRKKLFGYTVINLN